MVSPTRGKRGRSNPVDAHVGSRVRMRRTLLGLSQEKLGEALSGTVFKKSCDNNIVVTTTFFICAELVMSLRLW